MKKLLNLSLVAGLLAASACSSSPTAPAAPAEAQRTQTAPANTFDDCRSGWIVVSGRADCDPTP